MTYKQAVSKAVRLSRKNEKPYFVVRECGEFDVASDYDLDTFYFGISEHNILYCTADHEQVIREY